MLKKTLLILTSLLLGGCVVGTSNPSYYYMLASTVEKPAVERQMNENAKVVQLGPVELAKYLDRTNFVGRSGPNQVLISEFNSWAEPLPEAILRVSAQNIERSLNGGNFIITPWQTLVTPDYIVPFGVERFDCNDDQKCFLRIRWALKDDPDHAIAPLTLSEFERESNSNSADDRAYTMSLLLGDSSRAVLNALGKIK